MYCSQCEQTASGQGCIQWGACGKSPEVDALQDVLINLLGGLGEVALCAHEQGIPCAEADRFSIEALFSTLTNVNFDPDRFVAYIRTGVALREDLKQRLQQAGKAVPWSGQAGFDPAPTKEALVEQGKGIEQAFIDHASAEPDGFSLKLTVLYGVRGVAAYLHHAMKLGQHDPAVYRFVHQALATLDSRDRPLEDWVALALKVGEVNLRAMELLDAGHTTQFGHPVPTTVPIAPRQGKAILVSGHDLQDLEALLAATAGKGIDVYTHGELLPAHGYPGLKQRFPHLYGHYGTAWQNQTREFKAFPGPIVMTTNCLVPPQDAYKDRLYTLGAVGWSGLTHLDGHDFGQVIQQALAMPGFTEAPGPRTVMTGFARNAVLKVAPEVIDAVKKGAIRHFFLVGGCDGAKIGRDYYSEFVEMVPKDCVVLTLACGKFRFFDQELGTIGGLPRLLDVGQCNDAYSAIQIALALSDAFKVDVNHLPLSMILSWYEQKAVAILLTLLHLGIQNIRLGPTLPAFISPNVFKLLSQTYGLKRIGTPEQDLAECLA